MYENQNRRSSEGPVYDQRPTSTSAMAIAGLVLGIIALVTSLLPIINNISFFLALLGGIFAIVGLVATVRKTRKGKPLAIAALAVCVVSIIAVLASQSAYSAAVDEALSGPGSTTASQSASGEPAGAAQQSAEKESKYAVTIDDCTVTTDYSGAAAIVVTYTFANNSDKAIAFFAAVSAKAFQNGVQLDTGIVHDIDAQSTLNEIKSGASATVQQAYLLDDESEVSVECTELISFDDTIIAEKTFSIA